MDWIQFPFEVRARLLDGPSAPVVRLRWVYTDQPFLPPDQSTVITNRIWDEDQTSDLKIGQLPLEESNFKQDARWRLPDGLKPGHMCHPEWFSTGEPYPNDLPPNVYGPFGIPECCGLFQDPAEGGIEIGGAAGDLYSGGTSAAGGFVVGGAAGDLARHVDPAAGGLVVGGAAGDLAGHVDPAAGGFVVGGAAGDLAGHVDPAAGGLVVGGECGDVPLLEDTAAGGLVVGGECGDVPSGVDPAAGGLVVGGEAGDVPSGVDPAAGGLVVGGAAGDLVRLVDPAAGGGAIGGAAGDLVRLVDPAAGGLVVGGAAGDVWTPGGVTPGTSCATAPTISLATTYNDDVTGSFFAHWWKLPALTPGATYHMDTTGVGGMGVNLNGEAGADCSSLTFFNFGLPTAGRFVFTAPASGFVWAKFFPPLSGSGVYSFLVDTGP